MAEKTYITDMGVNHELVGSDGSKIVLERYGAWQKTPWGKNQVVEVSNDLEGLLKKYGVNADEVVLIGPKKEAG